MIDAGVDAAARDVGFSPVIGARLGDLSAEAVTTEESLATEPWAAGLSPLGLRFFAKRLGGLRPLKVRGRTLLVPGQPRHWDWSVASLRSLAAVSPPESRAEDIVEESVRALGQPLAGRMRHLLAAAFPARDGLGLRLWACDPKRFVDGLLPPGSPPRRLRDLARRVRLASPEPVSDAWLAWLLHQHARPAGQDRFAPSKDAAMSGAVTGSVLSSCLELLRTVQGMAFGTGALLEWVAGRHGGLPDGLDMPELDRILSACHETSRDGVGRWVHVDTGPSPSAAT